MRRFLTPQEKKVLSYAKDRRNTVAEARSKSRKAIAQHKALANRALRRAEQVVVSGIDTELDGSEVVVPRTGRKSWRKIPDAPLAEYIGRTLSRRAQNGMNDNNVKIALMKRGKRNAKPRKMEFKGTLQNGEDN